MTIEFRKVIWNGLEKQLEVADFFNVVFNELLNEIEACIKKFSIKNPEDIFKLCTEMSWIGLWNTAIVRYYGNDVATLREVSLYDEEDRYKGRPDLLVAVKIKGKEFCFLFEGKIYEFEKMQESDYVMSEDYGLIEDQANSKYKEHFKNKTNIEKLFIVPIIFEWMQTKDAVNNAKKFLKENENEKDQHTQFCALYSIGGYGMWVYGRVSLPT